MSIWQKVRLFWELRFKPVDCNGKIVWLDSLTAWQWANATDFILE